MGIHTITKAQLKFISWCSHRTKYLQLTDDERYIVHQVIIKSEDNQKLVYSDNSGWQDYLNTVRTKHLSKYLTFRNDHKTLTKL